MNYLIKDFESKFAVFALLFYSRLLDFESFFNASEAESSAAAQLGVITTQATVNPFQPLLSLTQHGIFLVVLSLLAMRRRQTLATILRGKWIWILILLVPFSALWSDFPEVTQPRSLAFIETCTFALYLASRYTVREQLKLIAWTIGILGIVSLFYTLGFPQHGIEQGIHSGSWRGPFVQKNIFARLLVLGSLALICVDKSQSSLRRIVVIGVLLLIGCLIVLAGSITALSILLVLLALFWVYNSFKWQDTVLIPFLLSSFLLFFGVFVAILSQSGRLVGMVGKDLTLSGRTLIWQPIMEQIQQRPLLGFGYMGFWNENSEGSLYVMKSYGTTYLPPHSHNGFLELLLACGLVGIVAFSLTFIFTSRRALIAVRKTSKSEGLWPIMYLSFMLLYNLAESTLMEHNSIFWIIYVSLVLSEYTPLYQKSDRFFAEEDSQSNLLIEGELM